MEFDPTQKKKKKKVVIDAPASEKEEAAVVPEPAADAAAEKPVDDMSAMDAADMFGKKKKKKTVKAKVGDDDIDGAVASSAVPSVPAAGSDLIDYPDWPDYTYDDLLNRVFTIMLEKNPQLAAGGTKKFQMKPPNIARAGTKKTAFINFMDICKLLKRSPEHVIRYMMTELGTSGSVDGSNQLIIKGRYNQPQFETLLKKYIKEYVACHTCKSADTNLQKEDRLFFLQCATCGSRCSVAAIKSGFQAVTTKRAATRAAAGQ